MAPPPSSLQKHPIPSTNDTEEEILRATTIIELESLVHDIVNAAIIGNFDINSYPYTRYHPDYHCDEPGDVRTKSLQEHLKMWSEHWKKFPESKVDILEMKTTLDWNHNLAQCYAVVEHAGAVEGIAKQAVSNLVFRRSSKRSEWLLCHSAHIESLDVAS